MKKTILLSTLFFIAGISFVNAQFNKGQKFITGGISFNSNTVNDTDTSSYKNLSTGISFSAGKFISPLHSIGWGVFYNYIHTQQALGTITYKNDANSFGGHFFSDYYQPLFKNFYVMLRWDNAASLNLSNSSSESKYTQVNISSSLNPGFTYQINKRFLFNATLNNIVSLAYSNSNYDNSNIKSSNSFSFSSSLSAGSLQNVSLGFTYLLK